MPARGRLTHRLATDPGLRVATCALLLGCSDDHPGGAGVRDSGASIDAAAVPEAGQPYEAAPPGGDAGGPDSPEVSVPTDAGGLPGDGGAYAPLLSGTGLFADIAVGALTDGVREFHPEYALWSDGATKRRWIQLPGAPIDSADMDFWTYPVGTKAWKEFTVDGKRLETRLLHKQGPEPTDWVMIAYAWLDDQSDAIAVPAGVPDAMGTAHDIPAEDACQFCHGNVRDRLLGFSALQLSHDPPGVTLDDLVAEGRLTVPPAGRFALPGDTGTRQALGYLHANCGDCHNPTSEVFARLDMELWASTYALDTVAGTSAYRTTVNVPDPLAAVNRIVPGRPEQSMVHSRMSVRGNGQMPPIGTETVDVNGLTVIDGWIRSLGARDAGADARPPLLDAASD